MRLRKINQEKTVIANLIEPLSEEGQAKVREIPSWMDPMLAKMPYDYLIGDGWIFE